MYINAKSVALQLSAASRYTYYATATKLTVTGTAANETLGGIAKSVLAGGLGDDYYALWDSTAKVIERAGEGVDTVDVLFPGGYALPDNVENLILSSPWAYWGTGNALNNILVAGKTGATLDGGAGDDVLVGGVGSDIFKVAAGNGSDAIVNFQQGWDVVKLSGYNINSFAQLKSIASQVGSDVQLGFANGEKLVLRDINLADLSAADFGFSNIGGTVASGMKVMNGGTNAWNSNGVYLLNMAWNPGGLKYGTDYQIETIFNAADTTKNATFNWTFPTSTDTNFSVKAYPSLMYGVSPYGDTKNVADTAHTFPIKLADLVGLTANFDLAYSGNKAGYNVAYDIWFTNTPNGGPSTVTNEIMIWTHKGSFDAFGTMIGTFSAGGITGKVYNSGTYTAIVTDIDMPKGSIDLAAVFAALTKMGILSPSNYLASIQLGAEVSTGTGALTVNNFSLSVATKDASGGTVLKEASGAGTTVSYKPGTAQVDKAQSYLDKLVAPDSTTALNKLLVGGAQKTLDGSGVLTGAQQVNKLSATATETLRYDISGTFVGRDLVENKGYTTVSHYDADRKMTSADQIFVNAASTVTKHYDKWWGYTGYDISTTSSIGATVVQHYDAKNVLVMTDSTRIIGGATVTEWWDVKAGISGVISKFGSPGNGKIEYLDGTWKILNSDEFTNVDGVSTVKHYDANHVLKGGEVTFVDGGGVRVEQKHDKAWVLTDSLFTGSAGADTVVLGSGVNAVHGGKGSDDMWAGTGADSFYFESAIGKDVDTVHNFSAHDDSVYLASSIFGKLAGTGGMLAASAFATDTARDANTRIIYDSKSGGLYYDADGTGTKAAVLFAQLDPALHLTAGNIHLM